MKLLPFVFCLFFLVGCQTNKKEQTTNVNNQEKDTERVTVKDIENLKYTDYALSTDSKEAVQNWQRYQELIANIEYLKKADFSFFGGKNELIINLLKDLKNEIPKELRTPSIKERLIVLETKILKFHSSLKLSGMKKNVLLKDIKEILVAISNLHLQINKKFEFESQIIENPSVD